MFKKGWLENPNFYKTIPLSRWIVFFIIIYMTGLSNNIDKPRQEILDDPPILSFLSGFSFSEIHIWFLGHMIFLIYGFMIFGSLFTTLVFIYPILGWFFTNNYVGYYRDLLGSDNDEKETTLQLVLITLGFCICTILWNNIGIMIK
tara:strand:- start:535 stop:972 length:438 start_codon:yes stop_codon:yes gene_type:complete